MMRRFLLISLLALSACAPKALAPSLEPGTIAQGHRAARALPSEARIVSGEARERVVAALTLGGTVALDEGVYLLDSARILNADVRIVGAGRNKSFLVLKEDATNGAMLRFRGERLIISGVSLVYQGERAAHVLAIDRGLVAIEGSRFSGGVRQEVRLGLSEVGSGVVMLGQSRGLLADNVFSGNQQHGLALQDGVTAIVRDNFSTYNGINGVRLRGTVDAELTGNHVYSNAGSGINYFEQAGGMAIGNYSELNQLFGIRVQGDADPSLEANMLRGNGVASLAFYDNSRGSARENICASDKVVVQPPANPRLETNACRRALLQPIQPRRADEEDFGVLRGGVQ